MDLFPNNMSEVIMDGPGPPGNPFVGSTSDFPTALLPDSSGDLEFRWADPMPNFSVDAYLELHLGPKHLPKEVVIPLTIVYVLIFLSGLLGNFSVCLVIAKKSSMHSATNYYLFSLAVSDLLLLIFGLPNDLRLFWQQYPWMLGETMCRTRALISEMCNYASILTIVAFTVERYIAICHPLLSQTTSSLPRVVKVIAANWVVAAIIATPYAVLTSVHYVDFPTGSHQYLKESAFCMMPTDPKTNPHFRPLLCFSSLAFFFFPMTLIVILYINIGVTLRRSAVQTNESSSLHNSSGEGKPSARKAIIRMLVAVVIAFFICWAPFHAQRLLFVYGEAREWPPWLRQLNEILYFAGCLYYFNATINPILYNVMSAKYREAFREVLCKSLPQLAICRPCNNLWRVQRPRRWSSTSHSFASHPNGRHKSGSIACDTSVLYEETELGLSLNATERGSVTTSATDVSEDSNSVKQNGGQQYQSIKMVSPSGSGRGRASSLRIPSPTSYQQDRQHHNRKSSIKSVNVALKNNGVESRLAGESSEPLNRKVSINANANFRSSNGNFRRSGSKIRTPLSSSLVSGSDDNETCL